MQRETHIAFGILLFVLIYAVFQIDLSIAVFVAVGAIYPDIDFFEPIRRYHRKLFHNVWLIFGAMFFIMFTINGDLAFGFMLGGLSHLLADALTPRGVYPFWPVKPRRGDIYLNFNKYTHISTGTINERHFAIIIVSLAIFIYIAKTSGDIISSTIVTGIFLAIFFYGNTKLLPKVYRKSLKQS